MKLSIWKKTNWVLSQQLGIDVRKALTSPWRFARFFSDLIKFRRGYSGAISLFPCVHDRDEPAGAISSDYFWQDLLVARLVYEANPRRHVDVGSRIDGFVAHVAAFREIEVLDVRPIAISIPGVRFRQADLMTMDTSAMESTDSLSCLHALEHFGLGRYGDSLNARGFELGLHGLACLLCEGGVFYLACPCGDDVVHFNAHRTLRPETVVRMAASEGLSAEAIWLFDQGASRFKGPIKPSLLSEVESWESISLALYKFTKQARS